MKKLTFGLFIGLLHALPLAAQDKIPVLRSSASSGSERLALYSFTEHLKQTKDIAVLNIVNNQMQRLAFPIFDNGKSQNGLLFKQGMISPIFSYDDNINGGNRNSDFEVGGFNFSGDPKFLAKEGIVVGAEVGGALRYAYGRGRYLDLSAGVSAVYSPKYDIEKYALGLSACSRNHIQGWTFLDFCARANRQITDLDSSTSYSISSTGTQLFSFAGYDHELSLGIQKNFSEDFDQKTASLEIVTSLGKPGSISLGLEVGETVKGKNSLRDRISLGYRTNFKDRPLNFALSRTTFDGGTFFGQTRKDESYALSVRTSLSPRVSIGLTARKNDSTVDFYSYDSISLDVGVIGLTF